MAALITHLRRWRFERRARRLDPDQTYAMSAASFRRLSDGTTP